MTALDPGDFAYDDEQRHSTVPLITKASKNHLATGMSPTGVVICDAPALSEAWFAARREGITATDIPKILGESEYGNAISVWMDKRGEWHEEVGEAAEWGTVFEEPIAKVWASRNNTHVLKIEMLAKRGQPWMRANLDRLVRECPTGEATKHFGCALEVKLRNQFVAGNWRDDMPDDVLAQVAWQRMVTGYGHIHVACNIGGQRLVEFTYRRDDDLEAFILDAAKRVWAHVQDGTRPVADANALLTQVLNKLYPDRDGILELAAADAGDVLAGINAYEDARLTEKAAKTSREAAKATLVDILGAREVVLVDGRVTYSYRANKNGVRSISIAPDLRKETTP